MELPHCKAQSRGEFLDSTLGFFATTGDAQRGFWRVEGEAGAAIAPCHPGGAGCRCCWRTSGEPLQRLGCRVLLITAGCRFSFIGEGPLIRRRTVRALQRKEVSAAAAGAHVKVIKGRMRCKLGGNKPRHCDEARKE